MYQKDKMKNKIIIISSIHLILNTLLLTFFIPFSSSEDVLITVGDGSGSPGSSNNQVTVYLQNLNNKVKGLQVEICDEGNYLATTKCAVTGRTSEFDCLANKLRKGCDRIIIFSTESLIEQGEGPIAIINYDVSERAPPGECIDLNVKLKGKGATKVSDENNKPLTAGAEPGEFCFEGAKEDDTSTTTTTVPERKCPLGRTINHNERLNILRNLRDVRLRHSKGIDLVSMYYANALEISNIVDKNPMLRTWLKDLVLGNMEIVEALSDQGRVTVNKDVVNDVVEFIKELKKSGSKKLGKDVDTIILGIKFGDLLEGVGIRIK